MLTRRANGDSGNVQDEPEFDEEVSTTRSLDTVRLEIGGGPCPADDDGPLVHDLGGAQDEAAPYGMEFNADEAMEEEKPVSESALDVSILGMDNG